MNVIVLLYIVVVYTVEFQKRGLPHAHICIFLHPDDKLVNHEKIDDFISAEIPDKNSDPQLYRLVSEHMMHGPCGADNPGCPCTIKGKCTKNFPKKFSPRTMTDSDGFPVYKRPDNGRFIKKSGVELHNGFVVGYNKLLLKTYQAHINVEWCNQAGSIKYLFKYINKGPDRVTATVSVNNNDNQQTTDAEVKDEIKEFYDCRYLSACEATWRILQYEVHYRYPPVERLPFHLPGQQQVVYGAEDDINDVLNKPSVASSKFLAWMECNETDALARTLTYAEFPTKFVWKPDKKIWQRRKQGFAVGRIHYVPPSLGEAYYLRVLLNKVKGPTRWEDIRTVSDRFYDYQGKDEKIYDSYRDTCFALGLLDDDKEYIEAIKEGHRISFGDSVRRLFVMLLTSNSIVRPDHVWNETWEYMSDDIEHEQRLLFNNPGNIVSAPLNLN